MSHEISLETIAERAHQLEIIASLVESYPHHLVDSEIAAIATLVKRLSGEVASWLIDELSHKREEGGGMNDRITNKGVITALDLLPKIAALLEAAQYLGGDDNENDVREELLGIAGMVAAKAIKAVNDGQQ